MQNYGEVEFVRIPAGKFMMGSPITELGGFLDESPQHLVAVPEFRIGSYPVTNEEYGRFLAAHREIKEPKYWGRREFSQPRQPVVGVNWEESKRFAEWIGGRLPSEAEWEYACRASTSSRFYSGDKDEDLARMGWYANNAECRIHPVGEKEPNAFGIHDMHGNVWEWCEDDYHDNYTDAPTDGSAWTDNPRSSVRRVVRGGSWHDDPRYCRSAYRSGYLPVYRLDDLGFRVVVSSSSPRTS